MPWLPCVTAALLVDTGANLLAVSARRQQCGRQGKGTAARASRTNAQKLHKLQVEKRDSRFPLQAHSTPRAAKAARAGRADSDSSGVGPAGQSCSERFSQAPAAQSRKHLRVGSESARPGLLQSAWTLWELQRIRLVAYSGWAGRTGALPEPTTSLLPVVVVVATKTDAGGADILVVWSSKRFLKVGSGTTA